MDTTPGPHPPCEASAPWLAPDLLPEAALGGQAGGWTGEPNPMDLDEIATRLRTQEPHDKTPVHWVEVPGAPRVVHVSEVSDLWGAQTERDLRHLKASIGRNGPVAFLAGAACLALAAFGGGGLVFLPALFAI